MFLNAVYHYATGTSQTDQVDLSTGGTRILALSTAIYLAGGLVLALLNLEIDRTPKRRAVHLLIAALALGGIIVAYGRATYLAVAVVVPVLVMFLPRVRGALLAMLPICVPFILLVAIALPRVAPTLEPTFVNRVLKSNGSDVNVEWRQAAAGALWQQVHESPINGVGFGKSATFRFDGTLQTINQDPHDSFLYLLAGGGILTLCGFLLLLLTFAADAVMRLRRATDPYQRLIVLWSWRCCSLFLVNAAASPVLSDPRMLLTIWAVMLLPSSIRPAAGGLLADARTGWLHREPRDAFAGSYPTSAEASGNGYLDHFRIDEHPGQRSVMKPARARRSHAHLRGRSASRAAVRYPDVAPSGGLTLGERRVDHIAETSPDPLVLVDREALLVAPIDDRVRHETSHRSAKRPLEHAVAKKLIGTKGKCCLGEPMVEERRARFDADAHRVAVVVMQKGGKRSHAHQMKLMGTNIPSGNESTRAAIETFSQPRRDPARPKRSRREMPGDVENRAPAPNATDRSPRADRRKCRTQIAGHQKAVHERRQEMVVSAEDFVASLPLEHHDRSLSARATEHAPVAVDGWAVKRLIHEPEQFVDARDDVVIGQEDVDIPSSRARDDLGDVFPLIDPRIMGARGKRRGRLGAGIPIEHRCNRHDRARVHASGERGPDRDVRAKSQAHSVDEELPHVVHD